MTMTRFLAEVSSVELSHPLALDVIRRKEAERDERMRKAKSGR